MLALRLLFAASLTLGCGAKSGLLDLSAAPANTGGTGAIPGSGGSSGNGGTSGTGGSVSPACAVDGPLATGVVDAHAVEVDDTHVYFTIANDGGSVMRVPKLGGPAEVIALGLGRPRHLALWQDDVYVTSGMFGDVLRVAKDGSSSTTIHEGPPHPEGIAVNEFGVVWVRYSALEGELMRLQHGTVIPELVVKNLPFPYDLALAGADVYIVDNGSGKATPSIRHVNLVSGLQQILTAPPAANGQDIAVDGEWVYYTMNAEVLRVLRSGGVVEVLGEGVFLRGITLAGDHLYWVERTTDIQTGRILRHTLSSGVTDVIADGQNGPEGIAHDDGCVYWANAGGLGTDGSVWSMQR